MKKLQLALLPALTVLWTVSPPAGAQLTIGSGSSIDLGTGSLDLGCVDLTVVGTLSGGTVGFDQARDVTIDPTGTVDGESATLRVTGDWNNGGTFNAGTGKVELVDGCGVANATVSGSSSFNDLDITTATAKQVSFEAGETTTVTGNLALSGSIGSLLQVRSTSGGVAALLDVQGTSSTSFVDVQDNDATAGNEVIVTVGSVKGANTPGWSLSPVAVPALGILGLLLVWLGLAWSGRRQAALEQG
jgi:hypothetical protein